MKHLVTTPDDKFFVFSDGKTYVQVVRHSRLAGIAHVRKGDTFDLVKGIRIALLKWVTNPVDLSDRANYIIQGTLKASVEELQQIAKSYYVNRGTDTTLWSAYREKYAAKIQTLPVKLLV